jgi:hypothetical protein
MPSRSSGASTCRPSGLRRSSPTLPCTPSSPQDDQPASTRSRPSPSSERQAGTWPPGCGPRATPASRTSSATTPAATLGGHRLRPGSVRGAHLLLSWPRSGGGKAVRCNHHRSDEEPKEHSVYSGAGLWEGVEVKTAAGTGADAVSRLSGNPATDQPHVRIAPLSPLKRPSTWTKARPTWSAYSALTALGAAGANRLSARRGGAAPISDPVLTREVGNQRSATVNDGKRMSRSAALSYRRWRPWRRVGL